jgi:predicted metal-binding membrane protein
MTSITKKKSIGNLFSVQKEQRNEIGYACGYGVGKGEAAGPRDNRRGRRGLAGYLVLWTVFSLAATLAQWGLHNLALISPMMMATSPILGSLLLMMAGVYQWTPLKQACLRHCRTPLQFLLTCWHDGTAGAFFMGLHHGTYCLGCCWLLMAVLFAVGVMNLGWIAALSIFVLVEKIIPRGSWVAKTAGIGLMSWGGWMAFLGGA